MILDGLARVVTAVATPQFSDGVLTRIAETTTRDQFGDLVQAAVNYDCKALIDDSSEGAKRNSDVRSTTRYVLILTDGLTVIPEPNDTVTLTPVGGSAETFTIVEVAGRDPLNTYYRCEVAS